MEKNLRMVIFVILIICSFDVYSFASNIQNLEDEQKEIQIQKQETDLRLEEVKKNLSETMISIEELHQKIVKKEAEIEKLNLEIKDLAENIQLAEQKLEEAEKEYSKHKKISESRLITIYESGETGYLDFLLKSRTLSDLISNYYLLTEVVKNDTQMLEELEQEKNKIEIAKEALDLQKQNIIALRNSNEKNSNLLANMVIIKNNYINDLSQEEKELQEKIDLYDAEIERIDNEIFALTYINSDYSGGVMLWPAPGHKIITSPYGYRIHPIFGYQRFHAGIDIGVPLGSPIVAANDGTVIKTAYSSSYGNMIMIDHGGGIVTLYAHLSEFESEPGDVVTRGTTIARSGSTGWSTGPHLHFEVRVNGKTTDPILYLKGNTNKSDESTIQENDQKVDENIVNNVENKIDNNIIKSTNEN